MDENNVDRLARVLWDYNLLHHPLEKADYIIVLGGSDLRVAEHAAHLFLEGWAPLIIFSGKNGKLTRERWSKSEAEMFTDVAVNFGVPKGVILLETESSNTGQNIKFSKDLLKQRGVSPKKIILVQKPYAERRAVAVFKKVWPEVSVIASSPNFSYENYPNEDISREELINRLVGAVQRIQEYPARGYQIVQEIPSGVVHAYEQLVRLGYNKYGINQT